MTTPFFPEYQPGRNLVRGLPFKAHKVNEFSPDALERHYEDVYGRAIRRLNEIEIGISEGADEPTLQKEYLAVANNVVLHEAYFESIGEEGGEPLMDEALNAAIIAGFGDIDIWKSEFRKLASSADGGWIVLLWSDRFQRLMNSKLLDEAANLGGAAPILALDMEEHAYSADFGKNRKAYVSAFMESIHWGRVAKRFNQALCARSCEEEDRYGISVAELQERLEAGEDLLVLDVRHEDDRERYTSRIMETEWRDSFNVSGWAGELPGNKPVVVYCMYGFWVSQQAAAELREHGVNARSLSGGITAWRAMGLPSTGIAKR